MTTFEQQFAELHRMARGEDTTAGAVRQMEGESMTTERLMELRETLSNGDHLTRLDRAHLLALIDAEIARQSVTDEAVQMAIEWHD